MALLKKETLRLKFSFLLKKRDQAIAVLRRDDSPQHTCQGRKSKWLVQSQSRRAIAHYIELKFKQQKHECGAAGMESFHEYILEYRKQMEKGAIRKAYKGLMEYILNLKTYLKNKYPDYFVSGSIYFGYMDITYFSFYPKSLGDMKLKIAIVFIHESMRFEVWLAGYNKQVQSEYWK